MYKFIAKFFLLLTALLIPLAALNAHAQDSAQVGAPDGVDNRPVLLAQATTDEQPQEELPEDEEPECD